MSSGEEWDTYFASVENDLEFQLERDEARSKYAFFCTIPEEVAVNSYCDLVSNLDAEKGLQLVTMESAKTSKKKEDEKWCDGFSGYSNHLGETDEQQEHQRKSTAFLSGKGLLQRARKSCGIGPLIDVAEGLAGKRFKLHTVNIIC